MLKEKLISLGYSENDIDKIVNWYPMIRTSENRISDIVEENFQFLLDYGYSKNEIIKMTVTNPGIFSITVEKIFNMINLLLALGYKKNNIIKISKSQPFIFSYSTKHVLDLFNNLCSLGIKDVIVIKMTSEIPQLYCLFRR